MGGYIARISASIVITMAMLPAAFAFWSQAGSETRAAADVRRRAAACDVIKGEPDPEPDEAVDPSRTTQTFPKGVRIPAGAWVRLVQESGIATTTRLGDPAILSPQQVTFVNLWASLCAPCMAEMPALKTLFEARRADWGGDVQFLPILVDDPGTPEALFSEHKGKMPPFKAFAADYPGFAEALGDKCLYRGQLPVSMIVGCNQQIRWIHFGVLTASDMDATADVITSLVSELRAGRCAAAGPQPPSARSSAPPLLKPAACGDHVCGEGETTHNCSIDCYCGNGTCDGTEDERSCSKDCLKSCGNGHVDPGENCENCKADVKCRPGSKCSLGQCVELRQCGNGKPDSGETCSNCPGDVRCPRGLECHRGQCIQANLGF